MQIFTYHGNVDKLAMSGEAEWNTWGVREQESGNENWDTEREEEASHRALWATMRKNVQTHKPTGLGQKALAEEWGFHSSGGGATPTC